MSYRPRLTIDALIFNGYDVLIDTRYSYREVVRKTVQIYLERALGLAPSKESLLTADDVLRLQQAGNFSGYWDLTQAFILYFIEMLPPVPAPTFPSKFHVPALIAYLQLSGSNLRAGIDQLRAQCNVAKFAQNVAAAGGGLGGAHRALPAENRHLLVADGDITKTNIVGRIFQELYLGADLFERVYGEPAVIVQSSGHSEHESLVIAPDILPQLAAKMPLGMVANRPRNEVERTLNRHNLTQYFQSVITWNEMVQAGAQPAPEPWSLLEAARLLNPIPARSAFVGVVPADMQAAQAASRSAPFTGIGCLHGAPDKESLRAAFEQQKATMILGHPNHLKELILG